jgi:lipopolysaccharide transport system permease protein
MPIISAVPCKQVEMSKHTIIKPQSGWIPLQFREWVEFFDLFLILTLRDIKLRYKQTFLGVIWVLLQPLSTCLIFALIFGRVAHLPSEGIPYILFAFGGMLPWFVFSQSVLRASHSIISQAAMISKVYFPRIMLPAACCAAALLDFLVNLAMVLILCPIYGIPFTLKLFFIPVLIVLVLSFSLGLSLIFSALNVFYRDFNHLLPFLFQIWMFASPLVYSAKMIPEKWKWVYFLNPMSGMIDGFRWALFGGEVFPWETVLVSIIASFFACFLGLHVFNRVERHFADII